MCYDDYLFIRILFFSISRSFVGRICTKLVIEHYSYFMVNNTYLSFFFFKAGITLLGLISLKPHVVNMFSK